MGERPVRFRPMRRASRAQRRALLIAGPVLWLVALVVLAYVMHRTRAVLYAVEVLAVSTCVAVPILLASRAARVRAERRT